MRGTCVWALLFGIWSKLSRDFHFFSPFGAFSSGETRGFSPCAQVRDCAGLRLQVEGKLNSLIVDSCADCRICVASLIATVEIVNCRKIQLQVTGCVPAVSIDKSQKVDLFVSREGCGVEITSSKSTEMNLNVPKPGEDGDWTEIVIPEQFHHKLSPDGKLHTRVSDLYSC